MTVFYQVRPPNTRQLSVIKRIYPSLLPSENRRRPSASTQLRVAPRRQPRAPEMGGTPPFPPLDAAPIGRPYTLCSEYGLQTEYELRRRPPTMPTNRTGE